MRPLATALGAAALLLAPLSAHAQYAFSASYNVLDDGNQSGLSNTTRFASTGQERGIAYRPAIGDDPAIVYIGRGGIGATDGRATGVIGIAAIKLTSFGASNYTDTGLITSGGTPAAFGFVQGITYDPVNDKVWVIDGSGASARVWYFNGGAVGGSPSGGNTSAAATAAAITHVRQVAPTAGGDFSTAAPGSGSGRGIAVRANGTTIDVALSMGTYVMVLRSTNGMAGPFTPLWRSAAINATGTYSRDVSFDNEGNLWTTSSGTANRRILVYNTGATGTDVAPSQSILLALPSYDRTAVNANVNNIALYREGGRTFLLTSMRSSVDGDSAAVVRFERTGTSGSYGFTALDGFGKAIDNTGSVRSDAALATFRYKSNATGTAPSTLPTGGTNASTYFSLPYSSTGDLTLTERAFYVNAFVTDASKSQTNPSSGVVKALLPPNVTIARYYDGSSMGYDYGTNDNPFLGLTATTDRSTSTLSSITVRRTQSSTATDSDTGDLKLWLDTNGDGAVDEASSPLATATMTGGVATFSGLTADATTTGTHLLITVSIPAEAPPAAHRSKGGVAETAAAMAPTFGIEILAGDIVTSGGASTVGGTGTLAGSEGSSQLPVELVGLSAASSARGLVVAWTTASETGNAGFGIEVARVGSGDFREVAFVSGRGTTSERTDYRREIAGLAAGRYHVRLRQVDVDGAAVYHGSVEAAVALADAYALGDVRPTPTSGTARLALTVRDDQHVRAEVYDLVGRRVAVLHDGAVTALAPLDLVVDGGVLPQGTYVVRVAGEHFSATRRLVVTR